MRCILLEHRDHGPDRERLEAVISSGKNPAEACVGVVLLSVDRVGTMDYPTADRLSAVRAGGAEVMRGVVACNDVQASWRRNADGMMGSRTVGCRTDRG